MSDPQMQSPLHAFDLPSHARRMDASAGVWANEVPLLAYISLRGRSDDAAFAAAASKALGVDLPVKPCTLALKGSTKVLWLSPDEWMIVAARRDRARLLSALGEDLTGLRSQVADNSGGYTQVLLQGRNATDVLTHTSVYAVGSLEPGRVVGTTFGKSSLYLHRQGDGYCLLLRRSFADYIWRYLVRAAGPYGFGVARLDQDIAA